MTQDKIIQELQVLYQKQLDAGNFDKAQEILLRLSELQTRTESGPVSGKNILLG